MRNAKRWGIAVCMGALWISVGCVEGVDVNKTEGASAGCEEPTEELTVAQAPMLPGRDCIACHKPDSSAHELPWTAAGTVYDRKDGPCNEGGVRDVKVEIMDENRKVLITLTTNRTGNFFTAEPLSFQKMIARISKDNVVKEMPHPVSHANCAACHQAKGFAKGHIYLP